MSLTKEFFLFPLDTLSFPAKFSIVETNGGPHDLLYLLDRAQWRQISPLYRAYGTEG